jgi:threonyl-tRNA synthetase
MTELARKDEKVTREVWSRDEAVALFESMGEKYKAEIIASIPPIRKSACIAKAISPTCAVARTCRPRASSRSSS